MAEETFLNAKWRAKSSVNLFTSIIGMTPRMFASLLVE